MRIIVSGGGTAGHISPALAVCDALKSLDSDLELLYVGESAGMEARIVKASGWPFEAIPAGKFRRDQRAGVSLISKLLNPRTVGLNARDLARAGAGVIASLRILRQFNPDVVFLKGGFVCLPVGIAAKILGIPYVIHESDFSPGLANRVLGRWASKIGVGFPAKGYRDFPSDKLEYVGNPTQAAITAASRTDGIDRFELDPALPTLLVTGGSQGAAQINDAVLEALPGLLERFQVIHQTGEGDHRRIEFALRKRKLGHANRYHPFAFFVLDDMALALAVADIVVGRAGVGTINDSAALGKPTVLIPNNRMAGHQVANARTLARQGAVHVLDPDNLTPAKLVGEVSTLIDNQDERERLGKAIRQYARPNAAHELARLVMSSAKIKTEVGK